MTAHFIDKCSCGAVLNQCRCASLHKTVTIIRNGCENCKAAALLAVNPKI